MTFDLSTIRSQFPALLRQEQSSSPAIFFDNPGGTQITQASIDRINTYLIQTNANHGGCFPTSQQSDAVLDEAHTAMADFYHAARPEEIIFGNNMTTLTLHLSRSISRTWQTGDTILVTHLDHDANITPWVLAAQERGVKIRQVDFHPENGTLDLEDLARALELKPRLLAVGYASNALGTINPVDTIVKMTHSAGALVYIDAVQYAAHGPIDVQQTDCDFLVASSYKFFGPHAGILYGKYDLLQDMFAYKVRPAPNELPHKFETGTQNHEGIAGVLGAIEYLEWVGKTFGEEYSTTYSNRFRGRRLLLKQALTAIQVYENEISYGVLDVLKEIKGLVIYGLSDVDRLYERVPTFSFRLEGWHPQALAEALASHRFYVWNGNFYALAVTQRLGLDAMGGLLRIGPVHYNTLAEVESLRKTLWSIQKSR
jgi:cysteine desulfurase family protein (TIGR01976 family)